MDASQLDGWKLVDSMIDVVIVTDLEGRIIKANSAAEQTSEYSAAELTNLPIATLFVDALSGLQTNVRQHIADGHAFQRDESWLVTKSKRRLPVTLACSPVLEGRDVIAILIAARDAREIRQLRIDRDAEVKRREQAELELRTAIARIEGLLEPKQP